MSRRSVYHAAVDMGVLGAFAWFSFELFIPAMVSSVGLISELFVDKDFFLTNEQLALMAIARSRGTAATAKMRAIFREQEPPAWGGIELDHLEAWGNQAGLGLVRLRVRAEDIAALAPPFIVSLKCHEIEAVLDVSADRVVVHDRYLGTRAITRLDCDRRFTGYVLCLKGLVRPDMLLGAVSVEHNTQTAGCRSYGH